MRRRDFISGGVAVAWPAKIRAHATERMQRVGVLMGFAQNDAQADARFQALRAGLEKLGWVEGRNIHFDIRWATTGDAAKREQVARELVALKPVLIFSHNTPTTASLLRETRTIPIVFAVVADPIRSGFVASFRQPGGNVTGFTVIEPTLAGKWLSVLKEIAPHTGKAVFVFNPITTAAYVQDYLASFNSAAASLGLVPIAATVRDIPELELIAGTHAQELNIGLVVMPDNFTDAHRVEITRLAASYRIPAVYPSRFFPETGGLVSYGTDVNDNFHRAATYVDRILRGATPNDLPVQAPTKFELVINLKTAKAMGLHVPMHLRQNADEVIE